MGGAGEFHGKTTCVDCVSMTDRALITIVKGGLGNQLFIYAAARAMALRTGRQLYLDAVRGYLGDDYGRSFRLNRFPIEAELMPEQWRVASTLRHPRAKLVRALNKYLPEAWRFYVAERGDTRPDALWNHGRNVKRVTLMGYWQDEAYFLDYAELLRRELAPPMPDAPEVRARGARFAGTESVFLHVRRYRYSPLLDAGYYQKAVDMACAELSKPVFMIFGDDIEWVVNNIDFRGAGFERQDYDESDELADLWLMTRCRHAIIANSSFSWWAAWLGGAAGSGRHVWAPGQSGLALKCAKSWEAVDAQPE